MTISKRSEGGKESARRGVGAHAPGKRSEGGKESARLGVGCHAPGKRSEGGKAPKAGKGVGRKRTCDCGQCRKCKSRVQMQERRKRGGK